MKENKLYRVHNESYFLFLLSIQISVYHQNTVTSAIIIPVFIFCQLSVILEI